MDWLVRVSWLALAALHVAPSLPLFVPSMVKRLYGVDPQGVLGSLLVHRAALFVIAVVAALMALADPAARKLATLVLAISMVSFLVIYWRAGLPEGPLRTIAGADALGLVPLAIVAYAAWR